MTGVLGAGPVACSSSDGDPTMLAGVVDGSPPPSVCYGDPLTCVALSLAGCSIVAGCSVDETPCAGDALSCGTFFSESTCVEQVGCSWSSSTASCYGVVTLCDQVPSDRCLTQLGCFPNPTCSGTPTPCSQYSESGCEAQLGCTWGVPPAGTTVKPDADAGSPLCGTVPPSVCAESLGCCTITVETSGSSVSSSACSTRANCSGTFVAP